jgi:outer membrane protein insertion porin family
MTVKTKSYRNASWLVLALLAGICAVSAARPATAAVPGVDVSGNSVFAAGEVIALARAGGWIPGNGTSGLSRLQEAYFREGYLQASFEVSPVRAGVSGSTDSTVTLYVFEGDVARFGRSYVKGLKVRDASSVLSFLEISESAKFVPRSLDARIEKLLASYDEEGYPFAQVWIDSLELDAPRNRVHVSLYVVEGRERSLESVEVEGAARTRPELIVRMSGLRPGDPYRGGMLRDAYLRLKSSGVFSEVEYPRLRMSPDGTGVDAVLIVDEARRSNSFAGVLGYAAAGAEEEEQLSGMVRLRMNNIGGTLKDLHVLWTNDGGGRSETRLGYRDRFFLGRMLMAGLSLEQIGQDTLYTWQSLGVEAGRHAGHIGRNLIGFALGFNADRNIFSEGALKRSWRYRASTTLSLVRGDAGRHTFADIETRFTLARKKNHFREDEGVWSINQYIVEIEGEGSIGLMSALSLYLGVVYRGLESDEAVIPLSEQFYVGGARTLRGYRENQFHGRRVGTTRTELRLGSTPGENLFLFVDTGYILQEPVAGAGSEFVASSDVFKTGYGFGLRTRSQVGVIGLSFGVGDEVSLGQAKVHILLEQNF